MSGEARLVYSDLNTGRVVRVAEFQPFICPAELPGVQWHIFLVSTLPSGLEDNPTMWEMKVNRTFWPMATPPDADTVERFALIDARAECMEQLSRMVNNIRFTRGTNMNGWPTLVELYRADIEKYKTTGVASSLLLGLVEDPADVDVGIAELQIKISTYNATLISSEIFYNKWSRAIKSSTDPRQVLAEMRRTLSSTN